MGNGMNAEPPPEPPRIDKIDFFEFHPLDHSLWSCRGWPGGRRRHLEYLWLLKWRSSVRRAVYCRFGLHDGGWWWRGRGPTAKAFYGCSHCARALIPPGSSVRPGHSSHP